MHSQSRLSAGLVYPFNGQKGLPEACLYKGTYVIRFLNASACWLKSYPKYTLYHNGKEYIYVTASNCHSPPNIIGHGLMELGLSVNLGKEPIICTE